MSLFSLIIPTYNAEKTIQKALKSILSQTYQNFEVWVIDGESKDKTLNIVKEFSAKDTRVHWLSEKDQGVYDAMNKGIHHSKGEWLYFLGADDVFYDDSVLEQLNKYISEYPALKILYGDVYSSRFKGTYDGDFTSEKILNYNICHQAIFFKREVFDLVGRFNVQYRIYADWAHNWSWFFNKEIRHQYISLTIANYADGGLSSSGMKDEQFNQDKEELKLRYGRKVLSRKQLYHLQYKLAKKMYKKRSILKSLSHLLGMIQQRILMSLNR